jgi:hypothetical protein
MATVGWYCLIWSAPLGTPCRVEPFARLDVLFDLFIRPPLKIVRNVVSDVLVLLGHKDLRTLQNFDGDFPVFPVQAIAANLDRLRHQVDGALTVLVQHHLDFCLREYLSDRSVVETKPTRYLPVALTSELSGNNAVLDAFRSEHFPLSLWSRLVSRAHESTFSGRPFVTDFQFQRY